jgi:hypothetical protein
MTEKEDRISKLSQRFKTHATGRPKTKHKTRDRQSFYLDADLTVQIDKVYKDIDHQLYPHSISKSVFLETIIEYGLENLQSIKARLVEIAAKDENSS